MTETTEDSGPQTARQQTPAASAPSLSSPKSPSGAAPQSEGAANMISTVNLNSSSLSSFLSGKTHVWLFGYGSLIYKNHDGVDTDDGGLAFRSDTPSTTATTASATMFMGPTQLDDDDDDGNASDSKNQDGADNREVVSSAGPWPMPTERQGVLKGIPPPLAGTVGAASKEGRAATPLDVSSLSPPPPSSSSSSSSAAAAGAPRDVLGLTYVACVEGPHSVFLGPAPIADIADQIFHAKGPSGPNKEYLFNLARTLRQLGVAEDDEEHVFALEKAVWQKSYIDGRTGD